MNQKKQIDNEQYDSHTNPCTVYVRISYQHQLSVAQPVMSTVRFINEAIQLYFSAHILSTESRALLVMEFLRIVFTNFVFEKIISHEALVTGRVTAISNNLYKQSNAPLYGAINEIYCSSDVGSCDSFRSKFFARGVSCFKSFTPIEYAFTNFFKCSSHRNV